MTNQGNDGDAESIIDAFQDQMRAIAKVQQERVALTASATSRDKTVTVTVNANGVVIETKFFSGIDQLSYERIARTVTETAQQAADEVVRKNSELTAPLAENRARLPKLSEVIDGMPAFDKEIPMEPPVSTAAPGSPERADDESGESDEMVFTNVEEYDHTNTGHPAPGVTDSSW